MKKIRTTLLLFCAIPAFAWSQTTFDKAAAPFIAKLGQALTVSDYQSLANDFARVSGAFPQQWLGYYYTAYCNVRIAWSYQNDADKIGPYAKLAETQISKAETLAASEGANSKDQSEIFCIRSMIDRSYIFISPMSNGPKYGPSSNSYIDKAIKANPDNPRALYLDGWVKYNTPKMWGGDKDKAKVLLQQALDKLKAAPAVSPFPGWGKEDCERLLALYK